MNFGVFIHLNNSQQWGKNPCHVQWCGWIHRCNVEQKRPDEKERVPRDPVCTFYGSILQVFLGCVSFLCRETFYQSCCLPDRGSWGAWESCLLLLRCSIPAPITYTSFQDPDAEETGGEQGEHRRGPGCHRKLCFQFSTRYGSLGRPYVKNHWAVMLLTPLACPSALRKVWLASVLPATPVPSSASPVLVVLIHPLGMQLSLPPHFLNSRFPHAFCPHCPANASARNLIGETRPCRSF